MIVKERISKGGFKSIAILSEKDLKDYCESCGHLPSDSSYRRGYMQGYAQACDDFDCHKERS
jgi:hypothetical protein